MKRTLTCIGCPMGCQVTVDYEGEVINSVTGNTCPRGDIYARKEVTHPTRIVTTSVRVEGGVIGQVSVKTASDVPKEKMFDVVRDLKRVEVKAPVHMGDVVLKDAAGTGVDVIATKNVLAKGRGQSVYAPEPASRLFYSDIATGCPEMVSYSIRQASLPEGAERIERAETTG